jgi:hypothetical protein
VLEEQVYQVLLLVLQLLMLAEVAEEEMLAVQVVRVEVALVTAVVLEL